MTERLTAIEIVQGYLVTNGFDGLCAPELECGCVLSDLQPCQNDFSGCVPGYAVSSDDGECDFYVVTVRPNKEPS